MTQITKQEIISALERCAAKWEKEANGAPHDGICELCKIFTSDTMCRNEELQWCPVRAYSDKSECGNWGRWNEVRSTLIARNEAAILASLLRWVKYLVTINYIEFPED
jgi:hypothetical protein